MTDTIYVYLLDEGTDVWRPTQGRRRGAMTFEILPTSDYETAREHWQFVPGTVVRCEWRVLGKERVLVAVARVSPA